MRRRLWLACSSYSETGGCTPRGATLCCFSSLSLTLVLCALLSIWLSLVLRERWPSSADCVLTRAYIQSHSVALIKYPAVICLRVCVVCIFLLRYPYPCAAGVAMTLGSTCYRYAAAAVSIGPVLLTVSMFAYSDHGYFRSLLFGCRCYTYTASRYCCCCCC